MEEFRSSEAHRVVPLFPQLYAPYISELNALLGYLDAKSPKFDVLFNITPGEVHEQVNDLIHTLRPDHAGLQNRALDLMKGMLNSNGDSQRFNVEASPLNKTGDMRWTSGTCTKITPFTFRTLMPLHYCLDVLQHADLDFFANTGGIRGDRRAMDWPDTAVYSLRADGPTPLEWEKVGSPWIEIRSLEFGLDYTEDMTQFHVLPPKPEVFSGRTDREMVLQGLIEQWADLLIAFKIAQMNEADASAWPPRSHMPWNVDCLMEMPVVVWLRRPC